MDRISTEAWVLYGGRPDTAEEASPEFRLEEISFPDISDDEVLAEPIFGCWEGNMTHAIERDPVDVCRLRREKWIVLGNSGVVRVARVGRNVTSLTEGDFAAVVPIGAADEFGYLTKVLAYDAPNTMGLLAKQTKMREDQLCAVPQGTGFSLKQWAAFSLRYPTAWANWHVAFGCWRTQMPETARRDAWACSWGGGVGLAEMTLANLSGCRAAMIASTDERLELIASVGVEPIDRRQFPNLEFDAGSFETDRRYRAAYLKNERTFLDILRSKTEGRGISIFVDNIGRPVFRATLRALARQGVVASVGWKLGMDLSVARAVECINRHIHVYTHGASFAEGLAAARFAEETGWMAPVSNEVYAWADVGRLAHDFAQSRVRSYFPLFQVNAC